jgi:hypothetical protein
MIPRFTSRAVAKLISCGIGRDLPSAAQTKIIIEFACHRGYQYHTPISTA